MATSPRPTRSPGGLLGLAAGAAVVAALVAFLAGRFTADAATSPIEVRGARGGDRTATQAAQTAWATEPARRAEAARLAPPMPQPAAIPRAEVGPSAPAVVPALIPAPGQSSPAIAAASARAAVETKQQLEALRGDLLQKCWPAAGLPKGRSSARVTFSVAYDAHGREVARGVSDDRRAPAGELGKCLGRQPLGTLRVSPPGTSVSVKVALSLP